MSSDRAAVVVVLTSVVCFASSVAGYTVKEYQVQAEAKKLKEENRIKAEKEEIDSRIRSIEAQIRALNSQLGHTIKQSSSAYANANHALKKVLEFTSDKSAENTEE